MHQVDGRARVKYRWIFVDKKVNTGVVKEINNFLPEKEFLDIKEFFLSSWMPWFYNKNQTTNSKKDTSFFSHRFLDNKEIMSDLYQIVEPIIKKIKHKELLRVQANLTINRKKQTLSNFHVDWPIKHKVSIYYITTSNGFTLLDPKNKKKIKCEENKLVTFDGKTLHAAVSQTDKDQRIVLNINYK